MKQNAGILLTENFLAYAQTARFKMSDDNIDSHESHMSHGTT